VYASHPFINRSQMGTIAGDSIITRANPIG
jgi:hypothetical protein